MRHYLIAALALVACKKDAVKTPTTSRSPAAADALWALAPEGASVGVVVTPRALELLEGGVTTVQAFVKASPELAPLAAQLDARLEELLGGGFTSLAALGIDRSRGFAMWETSAGGVMVVPVGDRAKLLQQFHLDDRGADHLGGLTCKTINAALVCAADAAALATLGRGAVPKPITAIGARGDIELVVDGPTALGAVVQLEPGAFVIRGGAVAPPALARMLDGRSKARIGAGTTAGFGVLSLTGLLANVPDGPLVAGVTLGALVRTIGGPLTVTVAAGTTTPDVRVPLTDPSLAATVIAHCAELVPPAMLAPQQPPGGCRIVVPQYNTELDVWVDGKELRVGKQGAAAAARSVPMTALGDELAGGEWTAAFWGRGTIVGAFGLGALPPTMPGGAAMVTRLLALFNELGVAVRLEGPTTMFVVGGRTVWANPPDVTAKVLAIAPEDIAAGKSDRAAAIAKAAPRSPFAGDLAAGPGGLMVPSAVVGMLAAVAIPAFMDYTTRAKRSEAELNLGAIGKAAKVYYIEHGELPKGAAPLTPARSCCEDPSRKCQPVAADWMVPAWDVLDFGIDDPFYYRYAYTSDGATLTATAASDLDCDGTEATWTMVVSTTGGTPEMTITRPTTPD